MSPLSKAQCGGLVVVGSVCVKDALSPLLHKGGGETKESGRCQSSQQQQQLIFIGGGGGGGGDGRALLTALQRRGWPSTDPKRDLSVVQDVRDTSTSTREEVAGPVLATSASHEAELAREFKPVEHPAEPLIHDQPVKCPLPEPSISNDGRIWKERMSANVRVKADLSSAKEGSNVESETSRTRSQTGPTRRVILPSHSAPEHNIINLLEECNAAEI